jgi:alpha-N-arabinofuranosidase
MHLNAFIRHAQSVKMANLAQLVNVIAPMITTPDDLLLQSTFYPFELYSRMAGPVALHARWDGDTFDAGDYGAVRYLDVSATLDEAARKVAVFIVSRRLDGPTEVDVALDGVRPGADVEIHTITGSGPGVMDTFDDRDAVVTTSGTLTFGLGSTLSATLPPCSVSALVFTV